MDKRIKRKSTIVLFLFALACGGCTATRPKTPSPAVSDLSRPANLATVLLNQKSALAVEDVFACKKNLFVKFNFTSQESDTQQFFYARAGLDFHAANGKGSPRGFSVPLEFVSEGEWDQKSRGKEPVQFLESYQWPRLKETLAKDLLDQQKDQGVSVYFEQEEFVLYYDAFDQLGFVPKDQAPEGITISREIPAQEVQAQFFKSLKSFGDQAAKSPEFPAGQTEDRQEGTNVTEALESLPAGEDNPDSAQHLAAQTAAESLSEGVIVDDLTQGLAEKALKSPPKGKEAEAEKGEEAPARPEQPAKGSSKILLSVNKEEKDSNPFIYVDLDEQIIANLYFSVSSQRPRKSRLVKNGIKTADYLIFESNVLGVVSRPVSSVLRLFYWSKNTALDMITPQKMVLFDPRPVPVIQPNRPSMDQAAFEQSLDQILGTKMSSGKIRFLIGGDVFFPRLITSLIEAKKSIHFRIFIFDNDDYAIKIADILKAKSKEKGVEVYLLLDRLGQVMGEGKMSKYLPEGFEPPDSIIDYLKKDSNIKVRVTPSSLLKADHIKTIVIDEEIAFTGGMNIGREYRYDWHDLMMELQGPIVKEILRDFDLAWANAGPFGDLEYFLRKNFYTRKKDPEQGFFPIRPLYTRLNHPQIFQAQVQAIKKAKNYIYINNAYFSDDTILKELIKARKRGVDVRVILPLASNHKIMNANNIITSNLLFKNGIRVYFYPGMSHVKAAIYDGWFCAGSANFDRLSFMDNKEFNVATSHKQTVESIKANLFERDFQVAKEMDKPLESGWKEFVSEILAQQL